MSLFEYVSVMVAVILALGVAQILNGLGALLISQPNPRTYWVHSIWLAFITLLHLNLWWYFWDLRSNPPGTIVAFMFALVGPAIVYLSAYVLLEGGFPQDAREHFYRVRRPLLGLCIAGTTSQLLTPWVLGYPVPISFTAGASLSICVAGAGFLTEHRKVQAAVSLYFLTYTVLNLAARFRVGSFTPG